MVSPAPPRMPRKRRRAAKAARTPTVQFAGAAQSTPSIAGSSSTIANRESYRKLQRGEPVHFKPKDPSKTRTIPAQWIAEAVGKGVKIDVQHAAIRGPLNLQYVTFEKEFSLTHCDILGHADFSYSTFKQNLILQFTTFRRGVSFKTAKCEQDAFLDATKYLAEECTFQDIDVRGVLSMQKACFHGGVKAHFNRARTDTSAFFTGSVFKGEADFIGFESGGEAHFQGAHFEQKANFSGAQIDSGIFFRSEENKNLPAARFDGEVAFIGARIGGAADFTDSQFKCKEKPLRFSHAEIKGSAFFRGTSFHGEARFIGMHIGGIAEFYGAIFEGDAILNGMHVTEGLFFSAAPTLGLAPAKFEGEADFKGIQVGGSIDFSGTRFNNKDKPVSFDLAKIHGNASFELATFAGEARFISVQVGGQAKFSRVQFNNTSKGVCFDGTQFGGPAFFEDTRFAGPASFVTCDILGAALFHRAQFLEPSTPTFTAAHFRQGAFFPGVRFKGGVCFDITHFHSEVRFQGTDFSKKGNFEAARFSALAQFSAADGRPGALFQDTSFDHARFEGDARLEHTVFKGPASFRGTAFRTVFFSENGRVGREHQFQDTIDLRGCTYERIQANWQSLVKRLDPYDRQPYTQLEKVLRTVGQDNQADDVYLERRHVERQRLSPRREFWRWTGDSLYKHLANYGVRPYRLLVIPLLLLALSTFFFSRPGAVRLKPGPNSAQSAIPETGDKSTGFTLGDSARLSIRYFLPVEVPLATHWEASDKQYGPLRFSDYATGMKLAGWILVPLGIAALTGLLRRVTP